MNFLENLNYLISEDPIPSINYLNESINRDRHENNSIIPKSFIDSCKYTLLKSNIFEFYKGKKILKNSDLASVLLFFDTLIISYDVDELYSNEKIFNINLSKKYINKYIFKIMTKEHLTYDYDLIKNNIMHALDFITNEKQIKICNSWFDWNSPSINIFEEAIRLILDIFTFNLIHNDIRVLINEYPENFNTVYKKFNRNIPNLDIEMFSKFIKEYITNITVNTEVYSSKYFIENYGDLTSDDYVKLRSFLAI